MKNTPAKEMIKAFLGARLRITLSDGRIVIGNFQCFDKQKNFILYSVKETRKSIDKSGAECVVSRNLGFVMVPGKHLVSCEVESSVWNNVSQEKKMIEDMAESVPTSGATESVQFQS